MATPHPFMQPVSPSDQVFTTGHDQDPLLHDSEGENSLDNLKPSDYKRFVSSRQGNRDSRDSGIQSSLNLSQSLAGIGESIGARGHQSRTSSWGSGPHPNSSHTSSEYSTDTAEDTGERGHYRISVEETKQRRKSEPNFAKAAVCFLPPQYTYYWQINSLLKRTQEKKLGSEKYKGRLLTTDIELLPDYTEPNNERMAKLKMKITLGGVNTLENTYDAYVSTTLYDCEASRVIGRHKKAFGFMEGKSTIKFLMNLGRQDMVERSMSKQLEIRVEVKVCGTSKFRCSENGDGYMDIVESDIM